MRRCSVSLAIEKTHRNRRATAHVLGRACDAGSQCWWRCAGAGTPAGLLGTRRGAGVPDLWQKSSSVSTSVAHAVSRSPSQPPAADGSGRKCSWMAHWWTSRLAVNTGVCAGQGRRPGVPEREVSPQRAQHRRGPGAPELREGPLPRTRAHGATRLGACLLSWGTEADESSEFCDLSPGPTAKVPRCGQEPPGKV